MSEKINKHENCLFCNIEDTCEMLYKDEEYLAFKDIRPAATHHYLIIPRNHIQNTSSLSSSDVPLLEKLVEIGEALLAQKSVDISQARFGFHVPPFNSIQHLHLHVIASTTEMGFISRLIFRPDSYWFITATSLIKKLRI